MQTSFATVATERYRERSTSRTAPGKVGGRMFANLLDGGFNGPVYPVNTAADVVQSVAAYRTVAGCPTVPGLVVVCVPAGAVGTAVDEAAAAAAKAAVIVSSGFADSGDEGEARQRRLTGTVRSHGMRVVGPYCMGALGTPRSVASSGRTHPRRPAPPRDGRSGRARLLVQRMITDGVEMAVGVSHDPPFGHVLVASLGGTLVELLADVSVRIHPLTDVDVEDMLTSLRGHPLLTGFRGSPPVDRDALKELLLRASAMVDAVPEITELDCNPVFVRTEGVATADTRVQVSGKHRGPAT